MNTRSKSSTNTPAASTPFNALVAKRRASKVEAKEKQETSADSKGNAPEAPRPALPGPDASSAGEEIRTSKQMPGTLGVLLKEAFLTKDKEALPPAGEGPITSAPTPTKDGPPSTGPIAAPPLLAGTERTATPIRKDISTTIPIAPDLDLTSLPPIPESPENPFWDGKGNMADPGAETGPLADDTAPSQDASEEWTLATKTFRPAATSTEAKPKRERSPSSHTMAATNQEAQRKKARSADNSWPNLPPPLPPYSPVKPALMLRIPKKPRPIGELQGPLSSFPKASSSRPLLQTNWEDILHDAGHPNDVPDLISAPPSTFGPGGIAAAIQSERTMIRHDDRESMFTIPPVEGFPGIDRYSPGWGFDNMTPEQVHEWENLPGAKLLLSPHGSGFVSDHIAQGRPALAAAAGDIVQAFLATTLNVKISAPIPATPPRSANSAPWCALAYDLSPAQRDTLLNAATLSTKRLTLHTLKFGLLSPRLQCRLSSLPRREAHEIADMVRRIIRQDRNARILLAILHRIGELEDEDDESLLDAVCDAISVECKEESAAGGFPTPVYNVYLEPVADDASVWYLLHKFFNQLEYSDPAIGRGILHASRGCSGCHAADHASGMCPFPLIPGWNGPRRSHSPPPYTDNAPPPPPRQHYPNQNAPRGRFNHRYGRPAPLPY